MLVTAVAIAACSLDALRLGPQPGKEMVFLVQLQPQLDSPLRPRCSNGHGKSAVNKGGGTTTPANQLICVLELHWREERHRFHPAPDPSTHVGLGLFLAFYKCESTPDRQALAAPRNLAWTWETCEGCLRRLALGFDLPA